MPDDRRDRLASFEQPALFIRQPLVLAPVFDLDARVVLVHAPVAQVGIHHFGLDAHALHQDGALLDLLVHGVPVIRIAWKAPGTHDQIALERHGQANLHTKLVRVAALALTDAFHLGCVPAVELGAVVHCFAAARLRDQALGLVQGLAQGFLHRLAERAHLATHFALQPPDDGALAFDHFAHAFELEGMGIAPSLVAQKLAFLGVGLLELNAIGFGHLDQLGPGGLQQLAIGGVSHGFLLHRGVHDHAAQFFLGDQLEGDGHLHGAGKQLFHAFFAQSFAEAPQLCGVAWPLVLEIFVARKVLSSGCFAPALDHFLVALVERMLEVQQGHHQPGGQTRTPDIGDAATGNDKDRAKQVQVFDLFASLDLTRPALGERCFDFLPGHSVGQHRQRVAQIDHLIEAVAEKVIGHGAAFKNSQKTGSIQYLFESYDHPDSPHITSIHAGYGGGGRGDHLGV